MRAKARVEWEQKRADEVVRKEVAKRERLAALQAKLDTRDQKKREREKKKLNKASLATPRVKPVVVARSGVGRYGREVKTPLRLIN
jgi:hypothetical protein